ncbi:MAG TPA: UbiX family flavin prenyltransferase [Candidatus Angelobacter sp.]|jgi:4-hydroxy-3-polyprenylbenzoate decarboxylase|nr:UbiX family flavin prenyltransferase [Candidatus Angelobacter sp.]
MPNPLHSTAHVLTVAATGASGALFTRALLQATERDDRINTVNFIASDNALRVFAEELDIKGRNNLIQQLIGTESKKIRAQNNDDIGGNVASGSYPTHAMIVIPCSMGTLARVAHGLAGNLIDRAADVCLKEKRPLVLCTRETPLNRVHIRNMDWAAEAGATIYPLSPTFYNQPKSFEEMAHQFACRVLQFVGLEQKDAYRWGGENPPRRRGGMEKSK